MHNEGLTAEEAVKKSKALLGVEMDQPLGEQYLQYMNNLLHGDLGTSYKSPGKPVSQIIADRLPWTIFSVGLSLFISFNLGMLFGLLVVCKRGSWVDYLFTAIAAVLDALPSYLIAISLPLILGVVLKIVPICEMRGATPPVQSRSNIEFVEGVFKHARVPILAYVLSTVGAWMLTMKHSATGELREDYIVAAQARGLSEWRINTAYVGRNASLPMFTRLAVEIGFVLGGSLVIEKMFVYKGVGYLLARQVSSRDYPVVQGVFLVVTISVVISNVIADFLYGWLDPRIRIVGKSH